jgi:hypothetical protein
MPNDPTDLWHDPTIDIDKLTPAEQHQLTRLMRRLGMGLWETLATMRERMLFLTDPNPGTGERVTAKKLDEREDFVTRDYFDKAEVPAPDANVDIIMAMFWAERDREAFAELLADPKLTLKAVLSGMVNQELWCCFLARRDPDPRGRQRAAVMADEWRASINRALERMTCRIEKQASGGKRRVGDLPPDLPDDYSWPASDPLLGDEGHR